MDLIFANGNHEDIGVLFDCTFDLAFGRDENNFELTIALEHHCMEQGFFIYIEGTEYGGIVDGIKVDTDADTVTYTGRTWHGILQGNIIEPDPGFDHLTVSGDANEVIGQLITRLGLDSIFKASKETSPITVSKYNFRYKAGYNGICDMLAEFGGKLRMTHMYNHVILSAVNLIDHSQDEEWDSTQVDFDIEKNFRPVNHLVCLGSGNMKDRHVIHLFVDSGGGIMPYTTSDNPVEDADYILDLSQQIFTGVDEVADTYSYPQAETITNYILLEKQPSDWSENYGTYYRRDEMGNYVAPEGRWVDTYTVLTSQPSDWSVGFADYFMLSGGSYEAVQGDESQEYFLMDRKPSDWETNWKSYFTRTSDGLTENYSKVSGDKVDDYRLQTMQPSDWKVSPGKYYRKVTKPVYKNEYRAVTQEIYEGVLAHEAAGEDPWGEGGYLMGNYNIYQKNMEDYAWIIPYVTPPERPADFDTNYSEYYYCARVEVDAEVSFEPYRSDLGAWYPNQFYTKTSKEVAPKFERNTYYMKHCETFAPVFTPGVYYSFAKVFHKPSFASDTFFRMAFDHFKELVEAGVKRLKELMEGDSIKVSLDLEGRYDIGDIVGAHEQTTGVSVWKPITKKIVSIKDDQETITYEIGGR